MIRMRKTLVAISVGLLIGGCSFVKQKPEQQILTIWKGGGSLKREEPLVGGIPLWVACGLVKDDFNEYMKNGWTVKSITPYSYPLGNRKDGDYVCTVADVLLEK